MNKAYERIIQKCSSRCAARITADNPESRYRHFSKDLEQSVIFVRKGDQILDVTLEGSRIKAREAQELALWHCVLIGYL